MNRTTVAKGMLIAGASAALILAGNVTARAGEHTHAMLRLPGVVL